jgi:hypothetical protein
MTPYCLVRIYQCFGVTCCPHYQRGRISSGRNDVINGCKENVWGQWGNPFCLLYFAAPRPSQSLGLTLLLSREQNVGRYCDIVYTCILTDLECFCFLEYERNRFWNTVCLSVRAPERPGGFYSHSVVKILSITCRCSLNIKIVAQETRTLRMCTETQKVVNFLKTVSKILTGFQSLMETTVPSEPA